VLVCGDRVTQAAIADICDGVIAFKPNVTLQFEFNGCPLRANDVFHVRLLVHFFLSAYHAIGGSGGLG
jgi:hypothetical protein